MEKLTTLDWVAFVLTVVGGLNWGLVGLFDFDLVVALFGADSVLTTIVFVLVGLSALYLAVMAGKLRRV